MKAGRAQNVVALILAVGILASLGVRIWATGRVEALVGPNIISAQGDTVCLHMNGTLYFLSAAGDLREQVPLSSLGISGHPSDLQLLNNGDILFGDLEKCAISRCTINGSTRECRVIAPSSDGAFEAPFKFFLDESRNHLYITDTNRHRLLVQDMADRVIREVADRKVLHFPNAVKVGADGLIRVADTNNHRILSLKIEDAGVEKIGELSANTEIGRSGHTWPVFFSNGPSDDWWVLNANGALKLADLVVYNASGKALRRIPLPENAGPVCIALAGGKLLVSDEEYLKVRVIDPISDSMDEFGDESFQREVRGVTDSRKAYRRLSQNALHAVIGFGIAAFGLAISLVKRQRRKQSESVGYSSSEPSAMSDYPGVQWLEQDKKILSQLRRMNWILVATLLGLVLVCILIVLHNNVGSRRIFPSRDLSVLTAMLGFLAAILVFSVVLAHRRLQGRLGSDGKMLYLSDYRGTALRALPEEVVYTDSQVGFGRLIVFTRVGFAPLFPRKEFEQRIRPFLDRAQKIGSLNMAIYRITAFRSFEAFWFLLTFLDIMALVLWVMKMIVPWSLK